MKKALKLSKISTPTSKQDESVRPIERIVEGLSEKNRNFESVGEAANQVSVKDGLIPHFDGKNGIGSVPVGLKSCLGRSTILHRPFLRLNCGWATRANLSTSQKYFVYR